MSQKIYDLNLMSSKIVEIGLGHTVPCDFIKQDELQKLLSVHHDVLARPLEESTD